MLTSLELKNKHLKWLSFGVILLFSFLPLLLKFPYRVNIYVAWEGAYRMYLGQIPFKDFGIPLGYGFWLIPFLFFKIFGPAMFTLIKAQAFINLFSLLTFRGILRLFKLKEATVFFSVLVMCLSFTLINFWPWYNHTVFFFEIIAVYFALYYIIRKKRIYFLVLSTLFIWLALLTKQDGGALTFLVVFSLLIIDFFYMKQWKPLLIAIGSFIGFYLVLILPFLQYEFGYWFNYGQSPHYSRVSSYNFINDIFTQSNWIKGYFLAVVLIVLYRYNSKGFSQLWKDKSFVLFTLFTIGILIQAALIQVTSFSPPTVNLYFHSFAFAYILFNIQERINFNRALVFGVVLLFVLFWKSDNYWKYSQPLFTKIAPSLFTPPPPDVVSKGNWAAKKDTVVKREPVRWVESGLKTLNRIKLPKNTVEGIKSIQELEVVKTKEENIKVLNMSNLTFLAAELNYEPETGKDFPLWYHRGVALFDREVDMLCEKLNKAEYDLVLFEDMPNVDNFFPYEVIECAQNKYQRVDKFLSPTGYISDSVEVYVLKGAQDDGNINN
ncbi:hypothetical protein JKA74_15850 [Marivirga sp. S37H4]|uniref:Uncharacterized protein n=1 Tax=Marivirga aurantiaca TaxID=2802615 RepID=A0A934X0A3_9BACT|nr:hypothetical protein [Marivirga aurantiaca]MBK6266519.1 hypothetical protein [Marivirga aurantiaca]